MCALMRHAFMKLTMWLDLPRLDSSFQVASDEARSLTGRYCCTCAHQRGLASSRHAVALCTEAVAASAGRAGGSAPGRSVQQAGGKVGGLL